MTPLINLPALVSQISMAVLVIPTVLGLIALRGFLLWRADRREEQFTERCRSIDAHGWRSRRAA